MTGLKYAYVPLPHDTPEIFCVGSFIYVCVFSVLVELIYELLQTIWQTIKLDFKMSFFRLYNNSRMEPVGSRSLL